MSLSGQEQKWNQWTKYKYQINTLYDIDVAREKKRFEVVHITTASITLPSNPITVDRKLERKVCGRVFFAHLLSDTRFYEKGSYKQNQLYKFRIFFSASLRPFSLYTFIDGDLNQTKHNPNQMKNVGAFSCIHVLHFTNQTAHLFYETIENIPADDEAMLVILYRRPPQSGLGILRFPNIQNRSGAFIDAMMQFWKLIHSGSKFKHWKSHTLPNWVWKFLIEVFFAK